MRYLALLSALVVTLVASNWRMMVTIRGPFSTISGTGTSSTPAATPSLQQIDSAVFGKTDLRNNSLIDVHPSTACHPVARSDGHKILPWEDVNLRRRRGRVSGGPASEESSIGTDTPVLITTEVLIVRWPVTCGRLILPLPLSIASTAVRSSSSSPEDSMIRMLRNSPLPRISKPNVMFPISP